MLSCRLAALLLQVRISEGDACSSALISALGASVRSPTALEALRARSSDDPKVHLNLHPASPAGHLQLQPHAAVCLLCRRQCVSLPNL